MGEVRYSVNGKYFKDYNVLISSSDGIGDGLKRKSVNTYDWAEYHGMAPDLSNPKFEAREITLGGFVIGSHWDEMMENFNTILYEFQKSGTQRLMIEPFAMKTRVYEVYMTEDVNLKKTFKEGKMVGVFTLKLIEPNPIKKVLYFTGDKLNLSYTSPNETEIFYGNGLKETAKGNVSLSGKVLANRVVSGYAFEGRNPVSNKTNFVLTANSNNSAYGVYTTIPDNLIDPYSKGGVVVLSLDLKIETTTGESAPIRIYGTNANPEYTLKTILTPPISNEWQRYNFEAIIQKSNSGSGVPFRIEFYNGALPTLKKIFVRNVQIEFGITATPFRNAPEDEKYIIIAGNVEEITDLTTNADVLWERL